MTTDKKISDRRILELDKAINNIIMFCDSQEEILVFAVLMAVRAREIHSNLYGKEAAVEMLSQVAKGIDREKDQKTKN